MKALRIAIPARTAVALFATALLSSSAMAQPHGNARLSGKVVDDQGNPIENVLVTAQMAGQTDSLSGKTDKKGEWKHQRRRQRRMEDRDLEGRPRDRQARWWRSRLTRRRR